jgi:ABC-type antimicrobial peptide transport system permease subunit
MSGYEDYAIENNFDDPTKFNEYLTSYLTSSTARILINEEIRKLSNKIIDNIELDNNQINKLAKLLEDGYIDYARKNNKPDPTKLKDSFIEYLNLDSTKKIISEGIYNAIDVDDIKAQVLEHENESNNSISKQLNKVLNSITNDIASNVQKMMINTMKNLPKALSIDTKKFGSAFKMNLSEEEIKSFINAMVSNSESSYENNMKYFGYAEEEDVYEIDIYPKNFESKQSIMALLDDYNDKMTKLGETDKTISYTDLVGTMLASVTTIVNVISYVLIAFVAISLVVSSIMIGVITYISVLERRKEIGILRSIGASKKNISQVFNAETGIIGLFAGVLGVIISLLLFIPTNIILRHVTDISNITAYLKISEIISLILISMILTLIGGLIPSKSAANQNPVEALRTD